MVNHLLDKLGRGEKAVGTFFVLGGSAVAECLGLAGIDYIIADTEHGPFSEEGVLAVLGMAERYGTTVLARTKDGSRASVLRMLDIGVRGLIVPNIRRVDEVEALVEYGKYYPQGQRGVNYARGAGFGFADFCSNMDVYFNTCNARTMLIPQCETVECLERIEEIAGIRGISGIFVGPYDLSVAMGIPAQFGEPAFRQALERILAACRQAGVYCFTYAADAAAGRAALSQGFDSVAVGNEAVTLINGYRSMLDSVRGASNQG